MTYTIIIILISAALIGLTVISERKPKLSRQFVLVNMLLAILGALMIVVSHIMATNKIDMFMSDAGFHSWASDYYQLYYSISLPAYILLFGTNSIAALVGFSEKSRFNRISRILRLIVSVCSSVLLLLLPYYGLITQNNYLKLYIYIMISGVGQAFTIRLADMLGLINKIRKS